jgi:hypothetical protein
VARGVIEAEVGLNLNEASCPPVRSHQQLADQGLGDLPGVAQEELAR